MMMTVLQLPGGGCGKVCGVGVADGGGVFVATGVGAGVGIATGGLGFGCTLAGGSQTQMQAVPLPALLQVACARNVTQTMSFFVHPFCGVSENPLRNFARSEVLSTHAFVPGGRTLCGPCPREPLWQLLLSLVRIVRASVASPKSFSTFVLSDTSVGDRW
jgi:hypothetical protein